MQIVHLMLYKRNVVWERNLKNDAEKFILFLQKKLNKKEQPKILKFIATFFMSYLNEANEMKQE